MRIVFDFFNFLKSYSQVATNLLGCMLSKFSFFQVTLNTVTQALANLGYVNVMTVVYLLILFMYNTFEGNTQVYSNYLIALLVEDNYGLWLSLRSSPRWTHSQSPDSQPVSYFFARLVVTIQIQEPDHARSSQAYVSYSCLLVVCMLQCEAMPYYQLACT